MKAAVLGSGLMGSVIAGDLCGSRDVDSVVVGDIDGERLGALKSRLGEKVSTEKLDVKDAAAMQEFLSGHDVVASALTHGAVNPAYVAASRAGARMVDIAFEDEQMGLDSAFRSAGGLLVPGCGLAPGLGGILLYSASRELGGADEGHVMVGGLPQHPQPPFGYRLVFSVVGLLREYLDDARVVRGGKTVKVRPFDEIVGVDFPEPAGRLEGFYTDGLATLLYTMTDIGEMDEMTLRYPGHAEKMMTLRDSGFLSRQPVRAGGREAVPYDLSAELLSKALRAGRQEDMTVMRVTARKGDRTVTYDMLDFYDERLGVTSMGRTTAYTASIVAQMVGSGEVTGEGTVPPEVALGREGTEKLLAELARRGVKITKKTG
jgi:saccharopine dehydrogenase-like NADP-dependent oxidoreductase